MSSNDEESQRGKKRRIERACDVCRRRKSTCEGSNIPGDKCYTCIDANLDCTYIEASTRRARAKSSYVASLEERVESLEAQLEQSQTLVGKLRAELARVAFTNPGATMQSSNNPCTADTNNRNLSSTNRQMVREVKAEIPNIDGPTASFHILRMALRSVTAPPKPPHAEDLLHLELARKFQKLSVEDPPGPQFIGKSSGALLVKAAIDLKAEVNRGELRAGRHEHGSGDGEPGIPWTSRRLQYWTSKPVSVAIQRHDETHPDNQVEKTKQAYSFPPPDLTVHLIDLYFVHVNVYLPLLHRPTLERGVAAGLHQRDDGFAAILLLVCAVASRWSNDPRVMAPGGTQGVGESKPGGRLACGWGWFEQVPMVGTHLFGQAKLYDLQCCCLAVQFLESSSAPQACWRLVGVGLRLAQDVGAHRRTLHVEKPSVERELWKRAFWVLVYMDRFISSGMGRTCAIQHDDFDLDPAIECDDEYWEHPTHPFEQPAGVPSRVAFFNALLRLNHILGFSLKTLYSLTKVRVIYAVDDAWDELVVAELDSTLNRWRDEVPEHLHWDPALHDPVFFDQSVALYCAYSHVQILVHRPFIPMVRKSAPTALPSLAICMSAARTCANMVDVQRRRKAQVPVVINLAAVFTSAIVLLLNVWSGKRTRRVPNPNSDIANVHKCMEVVRLCENRWQSAGRLWDILYELASVGQLPLSNPTPSGMVGNDYGEQHRPIESHADPILPEGSSRSLRQTWSLEGVIGIGSGDALGIAPIDPNVFTLAPPPEMWYPSENPFTPINADPEQASNELDELMSLIDSDTLAMWNAPTGVEVGEWGSYFSNFGEITQGGSR
ncbi:fungal-specific transcription factor domain-containing protein [Mycena vulgaris]|nr:fungal-specific transcription factor domain-containing protein [Mycena vulgaris]